MKTSTIIEYGAFDVTAKADSNLAVNDKQTFSNLALLKESNLKETKYSTLEKNHFVLDGQSENMGTHIIDIAWWSTEMTDSQGDFATPPVLTINFTQVHSSLGLTLTFSKYAYCNNLKIQYYNASNALILENTYTPDNYDYFCEDTVANYKKIVITFYSTNIPYRYLKLYRILYGQGILFEGDNLISANLLEQLDLLSNELTINTLNFVVYSNDDRFNILNPQGVYSALQQKQQLNVYENKNGQMFNMGTFYIDDWQSRNDNKMEFKGIDLIGLLDKTTFDGKMYSNVTVENAIAEIMQSAGFTSDNYTLQNDLKNISLNGYIPVCTHREALQQILFTIGAVANCARSDIIEIGTIEESQTPNEIERGSLFKGTREIKQGDIITGVLLKTHNYTESTSQKILFQGQLTTGTYKLTFDNPATTLVCTNGTIQSFGSNYAVVSVTGTKNVILKGYEYVDNQQNVLVSNANLNGNEKSNILEIDEVYLINISNAETIGQRIINYYNKKYTTKFTFILDDEQVGENVTIDESYGNTLNGFVTELDIDLTGGYVTNAEIVAKVSENS